MYSYRNHIRGIVDELVSNSIKADATKIETCIEVCDEFVAITIKDNGKGISPEKLQDIEDLLTQPRRAELEEYYGSLAGESSMGRGLSLIGMMSDEASITALPEGGTLIKVALKLDKKR